VVAATNAYEQSLSRIVEGRSDVVGFAYAVNGKLSSADVYASSDLFRRMWPKLLKASAVEALAERPKMKASTPPSVSSVRTAMSDADLGKVSTTEVVAGTTVVKKDSDKLLVFETRDRDERATWLHKSYIVK
jgi:hypothetical protein